MCEKLWWTYILQKGSDKMNELYHHGVKGMKWGIRRYQNSDGTLTAKGKKKYSESNRYITKNGETVDIITSKSRVFKEKIPDANGVFKTKVSEETVHTMYANGKKVAIAYLDIYGNDTNLNWISTKSKQQGKGYAQTMMDHVIKYSKDRNGSLTMSLEVPDDDLNALHIYEKYGFKNDGKRWDDYGLTGMKRKL